MLFGIALLRAGLLARPASTLLVADQAQPHGVLARLRDIGAVIIELRTINTSNASEPGVQRAG